MRPDLDAMTEAELQAAIVDAARWSHWLVYHTYDSRRSASGFPDLVLIHPDAGVLLVAELKAEKGRVVPSQAAWLDAFAAIPICRVRLYRPRDLDVALDEITHPDKEILTCAWPTGSTPPSSASSNTAKSPAGT